MTQSRTARQRSFAQDVYTEKAKARLRERLEMGECSPGVESLVLQFLLGKPTEHVVVERNELVELPDAELIARAREYGGDLEQLASELESLPPSETAGKERTNETSTPDTKTVH